MIVMSLCKGLLLIAFCELFPTNVWQATTELNLFFKDLTSTTITVADMEILERYSNYNLQIGTYISSWFLRFHGASSDTLAL